MLDLVSSYYLETKPPQPDDWPQGRVFGTRKQYHLNISISAMERNEGWWKVRVSSLYLKSRHQMSKSQFFKSCVSEGLIPDGIKGKFNLAMDVNNQQLVKSMEEEMDFHSSRVLDKIYIGSQEMEAQLEIRQQEMIEGLRRTIPEIEIQNFASEMRRDLKSQVLKVQTELKRKLIKLRNEKSVGRLPPGWSQGSRNIKGLNFIRGHLGARQGARFPQNLRPHRRNRPQRTRYTKKPHHVVTEEELAARDPLILTKDPNFHLPVAGKELMRIGPKTCPTIRLRECRFF